MKFRQVTLNETVKGTDVVVVIDVCRAFSTAAYALNAGAQKIYLAETVEEAFKMRECHPDWLLIGEVGGLPIEGFDYWNSPAQMASSDLQGKTLVMRTTAGTRGAVRYRSCDMLFASSFVTARATVNCLQQLAFDEVTFVITGTKPGDAGSEDIACAGYMQALLEDGEASAAPYLLESRKWNPQRITCDAALVEHLRHDLEFCLQVNRFDFAMQVVKMDGHLILERKKPADFYDFPI